MVDKTVGEYELLAELARGGMGVVYKARHVRLGRIVALKLIKSGELAGTEEISRFHAEAEAAAQLDHPGIVPVYEAGEIAGQHYLAMAFVDGRSLWQQVREHPIEPREAARIMRQVAEAVQYAHDQGIVHRDIKPQNILLTAQGQPRVTDFGLAKRQAGDSGLTQTGQILGTPCYMPPEQAAGKMDQVGPLADVYSLGATLYCLLTGRPPFQAASIMGTLKQVCEDDPAPPTLINSATPRDLETICMKCLDKSPRQRYQSAKELADDLGCFLRNEDISSHRIQGWERLWRVLGRNRDDEELRAWGVILQAFAPIVLVTDLLIWQLGLNQKQIPYVHFWATMIRVCQFSAMGGVLWYMRAEWLATRHVAARQMWSQWVAFVLACHLFVAWETIDSLVNPGKARMDLFVCYPHFAIFSGILWFTLGSNFWGWCYLFGLLFFGMSLLLPLSPTWGPVAFGGLWFVLLLVTGRRLRRFAKQATT